MVCLMALYQLHTIPVDNEEPSPGSAGKVEVTVGWNYQPPAGMANSIHSCNYVPARLGIDYTFEHPVLMN